MYYNFSELPDTPSTEVSEHLFELVNEDERKKYTCKHPGCGKFFRYKSEIVRHAATHSESRPFICNYDNCFKAFKRNDALENHIRSSHTKETPFICPVPECGMRFTTHGSFRYHVLKHNKQGLEREIPTAEEFAQQRKQTKLTTIQSPAPLMEQPILKIDPIHQKLGKNPEEEEFLAPPPRFASTLKWEFVNDEIEDDDTTNDNEDSAPENQLNTVLEENKVLKQKLATSEKVIKGMQKQINDLLGSLFAYQSQMTTLPRNDSVLSDIPFLPLVESQSRTISQNYKEKVEELPMLDMINYNQESGSMSPSGQFLNTDNNSFDAFFSFGKEVESFNF